MLATVESPSLARSAPGWSLVAHDNGEVLPLRTFPSRIGRQPGLEIRLMHSTVSQQHAELQQTEDSLVVVDLDSRNGTFVNGERVLGRREVRPGDLVQFGAAVFRLQNQLRAEMSVTCQSSDAGDLALALAQFDKLLLDQNVIPHYQPIVEAKSGKIVAYESLARSRLFGLDKPLQMFRAAGYFHREAELSRLLRIAGLRVPGVEPPPHVFLNTHPAELADFRRLVVSLRELREFRPLQAITLEVHEAAAVDLSTMKMLRLVLDDLQMGLAYDDFGAGQARLHELVEARPDCVKFDRQLLSAIDTAGPQRQQLVDSLVQLCRQLKIVTLAEGVETAGEVDFCRRVGFQLMQGFYFGHPLAAPKYTSQKPSANGACVAVGGGME
jgi:EAL domain-containing protein (putative c-di-GMP-specific phosphodiesterase class I)